MKLTRRVLILMLVASLSLVGCGDDDDDTTVGDDDDTETTEGSGEGDLATYCEKTFEIETVGEPEIDFETATPEEISEATKTFATEKLQPLAAEIDEAAPAEVREHIDVLVAAVDELVESGDFETTFGDPAVEAAGTAAHEFDLAECGWQQVDVTATNYAFDGIPDELEAGPTSFEFANEGTELHEMITFRKADGVEETFDEILALGEEESEGMIEFISAAFGTPGEEGVYGIADLSAGEYIAICFIPVGTVDEETEVDGPPHFTQGMKHEFTVS